MRACSRKVWSLSAALAMCLWARPSLATFRLRAEQARGTGERNGGLKYRLQRQDHGSVDGSYVNRPSQIQRVRDLPPAVGDAYLRLVRGNARDKILAEGLLDSIAPATWTPDQRSTRNAVRSAVKKLRHAFSDFDAKALAKIDTIAGVEMLARAVHDAVWPWIDMLAPEHLITAREDAYLVRYLGRARESIRGAVAPTLLEAYRAVESEKRPTNDLTGYRFFDWLDKDQ